MNKCLLCQEETKNLKFCSKSCSAKITNKLHPKRKIESQNLCLNCGAKCSRTKGQRKTQFCKKCYFKLQTLDYGNKTKKECINESRSHSSKHKYEKIRQHAKRVSRLYSLKSNSCVQCGYSKHTELCHKKSIHLFSDNTLLSEINSKENIVFLCPNCHWELDNTNQK